MSKVGRRRSLTGVRASREVYEYGRGRIEVRFRDAGCDWIQMRVRAHGEFTRIRYLNDVFVEVGTELFRCPRQRVSCRMSSVFCPFRNLLSWLEALTTGVMHCGFRWDGEGPEGSMGWDGNRLSIEWGQTNRGTGVYETRKLEVLADRAQVVRAFYTAFRRFVESREYHPERYESLSAGELFAVLVSQEFTVEEFRGRLLAMTADEAERTLQSLCPRHGSADATESNRYITRHWNAWTIARRRQHIDTVFAWGGFGDGFGAPLRQLRSPRVEEWLGWPPVRERRAAPGGMRCKPEAGTGA